MTSPDFFIEQVSLSTLVHNLVYLTGSVGMMLLLAGLVLIDAGAVRKQNVFSMSMEKLLGFFIGFFTYLLVGYALWIAQYYVMRGHSVFDSLSDWWFGGSLTQSLAQQVDPQQFSHVNDFQIFMFFLAVTAGIINVLFHFAVSERMRASAYFSCCVVITLLSSLLSWWTWGSVGPLSNQGYHDFFGVGFVYLFPAGMALVLVRKLGARPGVFEDCKQGPYKHQQLALVTVGTLLVFAALPMVIVSCLYFFKPGGLAISITMSDTSIGRVLINYGVAWAAGSLVGGILAYSYRDFNYALLGPFSGYIAGASGFDLHLPWQTLIIAAAAPLVVGCIYRFLQRCQVDDTKVIPLFAGAGSFGLLMVGLFHGGELQGGYYGIESGPYAFQHAAISLLMQIAGILTCLGIGALTGLVMFWLLSRTTGLEVLEHEREQGLDRTFWQICKSDPSNREP